MDRSIRPSPKPQLPNRDSLGQVFENPSANSLMGNATHHENFTNNSQLYVVFCST